MSNGMNKVILMGHLGADPELRHTGAGTAVLHVRLATNESWVDKNNERQERTEWHNVVVWGARAEALAKLLSKGSHVLVEGGLRTSSFEKDGQKRDKTEVHAREVLFVSPRRTPSAGPEDDLLRSMGASSARNGKPGPAAALEPTDNIPF